MGADRAYEREQVAPWCAGGAATEGRRRAGGGEVEVGRLAEQLVHLVRVGVRVGVGVGVGVGLGLGLGLGLALALALGLGLGVGGGGAGWLAHLEHRRHDDVLTSGRWMCGRFHPHCVTERHGAHRGHRAADEGGALVVGHHLLRVRLRLSGLGLG